jgi:uncharacterized protein YaiL (DUF2058 family)
MPDIRSQLLKAGLIDPRSKQQADTEARREKKRQGARAEQEAREAREREHAAEQVRIAEENRRRARAEQEARDLHEREVRARSLVGAWAVREPHPGSRRFCFVTRARKILWLDVSPQLAWQLEVGNLAIVERPGDADEPHAIVPRAVSERLAALDAELVRFWNREPHRTDPT